MKRSRSWEKNNPEKVREIYDRWKRTPQGRAKRAEVQRRYAARHKEKIVAQHRLQEAVKHGRVVRPDYCEQCGSDQPQAHHHRGYAPEFWFDVQWLCASCHTKEHR